MNLRPVLAEALGTALLLAAVVGSGIMAERLSGGNVGVALLANAIATGAALFALITMFGPISGGHFNPVVTLALTFRRESPAKWALPFIAAQFAGGILGVWLAHLMFELPILQASTKVRTGIGQWTAEATATFGLVLLILLGVRRAAASLPAAVALYIVAAFDKMKSNGRALEPFTIRYRNGKTEQLKADAVIDATGAWFSPNPAGADGLTAIGEEPDHPQIAYGMPDVLGRDRLRYAGKTVAVLGAGHSAIGTLMELVKSKAENPATEIVWLLRGSAPEKAFGGGANDRLAARGALGAAFAEVVARGKIHVEAGFKVAHIGSDGARLRIATGQAQCCRSITVDELVVATGFRPQLDFLREVRIALDPAVEAPPALAPLIDPNEHSCGTVRPHGARELAQPEPNFYFAGMKSYGRAPTFLMLTGYEQVRSIVAEIAGDHDAASRVELLLPETGVCSGPATTTAGAASRCC